MSKLSAVVVAALLLSALSGYAIAQSGSATPTKIRACAKKKGGALRIARRCRSDERRVTWAIRGPRGLQGLTGAQGATGPAGQNGAPGAPGADGADGTSTGETFFQSVGFGSNFGGGGACDAVPSGGPSITFSAPSGSYVQVMASVTVQRAGATSNTACIRVDSLPDVTFSTSTSLSAETRYLQQGNGSGVTDPLTARPLTFPVTAGSHTISMRYGSSGGTSNFQNRNLYVTLFHPATP